MRGMLKDRAEAGQLLAARLAPYAGRPDVLVLALPRGGVPVAFEIARQLNLPLDICLARKLGVPGRQELALGAIAPGGVRVINGEVVEWFHLSPESVERVVAGEERELRRRERAYRGSCCQLQVRDRTIILVDDGIATGATLRAAIATLKQQQPKAIIVAVPVAPPSTCEALRAEGMGVVCLREPDPLHSISLWYEDFSQTSDAEVCRLLAQAGQEKEPGARIENH